MVVDICVKLLNNLDFVQNFLCIHVIKICGLQCDLGANNLTASKQIECMRQD